MPKADNLPPSCAVVTKCGNFNFLEPSGPSRPVMELLYLYLFTYVYQCILRSQTVPFHIWNFSFSLSTYSKAVTVFTVSTYWFIIKRLCIWNTRFIYLLSMTLVINNHYFGKQMIYIIDIGSFLKDRNFQIFLIKIRSRNSCFLPNIKFVMNICPWGMGFVFRQAKPR